MHEVQQFKITASSAPSCLTHYASRITHAQIKECPCGRDGVVGQGGAVSQWSVRVVWFGQFLRDSLCAKATSDVNSASDVNSTRETYFRTLRHGCMCVCVGVWVGGCVCVCGGGGHKHTSGYVQPTQPSSPYIHNQQYSFMAVQQYTSHHDAHTIAQQYGSAAVQQYSGPTPTAMQASTPYARMVVHRSKAVP